MLTSVFHFHLHICDILGLHRRLCWQAICTPTCNIQEKSGFKFFDFLFLSFLDYPIFLRFCGADVPGIFAVRNFKETAMDFTNRQIFGRYEHQYFLCSFFAFKKDIKMKKRLGWHFLRSPFLTNNFCLGNWKKNIFCEYGAPSRKWRLQIHSLMWFLRLVRLTCVHVCVHVDF